MIRILRWFSDPDVRAIAMPIVRDVVAWVRGGIKPRWLTQAIEEIPELKSPAKLVEMKRRK